MDRLWRLALRSVFLFPVEGAPLSGGEQEKEKHTEGTNLTPKHVKPNSNLL